MIVLIAGSRSITRLAPDVTAQLDRIMHAGYRIVIGDAAGADALVQRYLTQQGYGAVEVYCSGSDCRNLLGPWPVRNITPPHRTRNRAYYIAKDLAMVKSQTRD